MTYGVQAENTPIEPDTDNAGVGILTTILRLNFSLRFRFGKV